MARIIKAYDDRKTEFLDAAQELFYRHGYSETPVSIIIDHIGVSKGTFYHYFHSKGDLLNQMVDRYAQEMMIHLPSLTADPSLSAIEHLNSLFRQSSHWKAEHKEMSLMLLNALYSDENLLLRTKMIRKSVGMITPILAQIIKKGTEQGLMSTPYPNSVAEMILDLGMVLNEQIATIILSAPGNGDAFTKIEKRLTIFERTVERMLDIESEPLQLFDRRDLKELVS